MVGILVHGDNHFIVRGPQPDRATALNLARHWTIIQIGRTTPPEIAVMDHHHQRIPEKISNGQ